MHRAWTYTSMNRGSDPPKGVIAISSQNTRRRETGAERSERGIEGELGETKGS
jgi:hypothetical protein